MEEQDKLTAEQTVQLTKEFLERLGRPSEYRLRKKKDGGQFVIVVGGAPGSGKTTVAQEFAFSTRTFHIQSNSARQVLREYGLKWGENVHRLIEAVLRALLVQGYSVTLDGMISEGEERELIRKIAGEYHAKAFFVAVVCAPSTAEARARKRYRYGRSLPSTFNDWRASPDKVEEYIDSIKTRSELLVKNLQEIPDDLNEPGVLRITNEHNEADLGRWSRQVIVAVAWIFKHL